jgi:vacuolar-type H+-ATPase subunit H
MREELTNSVEAMEIAAEKMLEEARITANGILIEAKEEAKKIFSSELPLDEVKTKYNKIISKARAEADDKIKHAEKAAAEISINADRKVKEITELVVNIVTGKS